MSFYEDASWLLIPSGIEEDIVFAQKPISGLGDLSFTRASDATYTDASGVVRRSPYNLVTWSEMFSDVAWAKTRATVSANTTTAPNGTLTADKIVETLTTGSHGISNIALPAVVGSFTLSFYAKKAERDWAILNIFTGVSNGDCVAFFNLSNGTIGNIINGNGSSSTTASIEALDNGWYRCIITSQKTSTVSGNVGIFTSTGNNVISYTGDGTSGIIAWGAQLVEGTEALDYFPTTNRQDVPRIDFRNADGTLSSCGRLLLEPQRTNSIRNSSMVGAVAGSPGTLPTNWTLSGGGGLTRTIVGSGTENGLPYIDVRFNGTSASTVIVFYYDNTTTIGALTGQTWTDSIYLKLVSGTFTPVLKIIAQEYTSAGVYIRDTTATITSINSNLTRYAGAISLSGGATTAFIRPGFLFDLISGATYDFTIRIAAPQMELGNFASTWVPTTTAAVTRLADIAAKSGVSSLIGTTGGVLFADFNITRTGIDRCFINVQDSSYAANSIRIESNTSNQWRVRVQAANVLILLQTITSPVFTTGQYKIAVAYSTATNGMAFYVNGVLLYQGTVAAIPTICDRIIVGSRELTGTYDLILADGVNQAALFPTRLTNAQLAQLTTL